MKQIESDRKSEKKIFSEFKKKNKEVFIEIYDILIDQIYRFIYFKVSNEEDAKDLTSSVFLKCWNHIQENSISDPKTLKPLLYKIARNVVIDHYRKNSNKNIVSLDQAEFTLDLPDDKQDQIREFEIKDAYLKLIERMEELKDEYREIIVLKYVEELSVAEIAKILDKSKNNIRVLAHRALKSLKEITEEKK